MLDTSDWLNIAQITVALGISKENESTVRGWANKYKIPDRRANNNQRLFHPRFLEVFRQLQDLKNGPARASAQTIELNVAQSIREIVEAEGLHELLDGERVVSNLPAVPAQNALQALQDLSDLIVGKIGEAALSDAFKLIADSQRELGRLSGEAEFLALQLEQAYADLADARQQLLQLPAHASAVKDAEHAALLLEEKLTHTRQLEAAARAAIEREQALADAERERYQRELEQARASQAALEAAAKDRETLLRDEQISERARLNAELERLRQEKADAEAALQAERSRGFWQRLFGPKKAKEPG